LIRSGISCDIFCRVVDNFGDIGVTWRLARQLALEYRMAVRLIVDDLGSFSGLEPTVDISCGHQKIADVTIVLWDSKLELNPAELVIEAFAVELPESYVVAMAALIIPPVWINLEYLSAEPWICAHHLLPSPHPKLPLTKYFFFPGFTPRTGGLIRESKLLAEQDEILPSDNADSLRVFLFAYQNGAGGALLRAMAERTTHLHCTVPEGELATMLEREPDTYLDMRRSLVLETIPFVTQRNFDRLLWRHDVLFVRGEDSFVRAQWAAKPFVWQIYPQLENAHWVKLNSFLELYCDGLDSSASLALTGLWRVWNAEDSAAVGAAWSHFMDHQPSLRAHAKAWSKKLAQMPDLAANLLSFYQETTKI
jgi:uncharacterized repeat protein (TIGR03837 family)